MGAIYDALGRRLPREADEYEAMLLELRAALESVARETDAALRA
jgi:hypothetical protein